MKQKGCSYFYTGQDKGPQDKETREWRARGQRPSRKHGEGIWPKDENKIRTRQRP